MPTLAETLKAQGFATAAFVSSFVLSSQSGLDRGFDHYDDAFETGAGRETLFLSTVQRRGDETIARVEQWLDGRTPEVKAKRTALWLHLYDPHDPYEPPEPYATRFADRPYDGEVAWTDTLLGPAARQPRGAPALGRRAGRRHRRPRRGPGRARRDPARLLRLRDDAARPVRRCAVPASPAGTHRSTARCGWSTSPRPCSTCSGCRPLAGDAHRRAAWRRSLAAGGPPVAAATTYAESLTPLLHYRWSDLRVLREGRWKYILAPRPELYDLAADPGETRDLSTAQHRHRAPAARRAGRPAASRARAGAGTDTAAGGAVGRDAAEARRARLRQPGRRQGPVAQGADPKDKIEEFRHAERADARGADAAPPEALRRRARRASPSCDGPAPTASRCTSTWAGRWSGSAGGARPSRASSAPIAALPSFTQAHLGMADARLAPARPARRHRGAAARPAATRRTSRALRSRGPDLAAARRSDAGDGGLPARWRRWRPRTRWSAGAWASCS